MFKAGSVMFFLKIALPIGGILWFHMNLRIACSIFVKKKRHWDFDRDCAGSLDHFTQ